VIADGCAQPLPRALGDPLFHRQGLTFVAFGRALGSADGQIIVFFVMTVAAAEAAVGLAIVISLFRHKESLNPDSFTLLKW
jgi:NADH-quinone oxidoreductase subunit K